MNLRSLSCRVTALSVLAILSVGCSDDATDGETDSTVVDTGVADTDEADVSDDTSDPDALPPHVREEKALSSGMLMAGVAHGTLDPPVGISMAGYGGRGGSVHSTWSDAFRASRGTHGLLAMKAVALDVDGEQLVFLKFPMMSSEDGVLEATHRHLMETHGLDLRGRVITAATHSHASPARYWRLPALLAVVGADTGDFEFIDRMAAEYAALIAEALGRLAPAEWGFAQVEAWDPDDEVYKDRRDENDLPKDPRLTLVAVRSAAGVPLAVMINFGMHGTVLGSDNDLLSEDAPGGIETKFEEAFFAAHGAPVVGMFVQSGGGDAAPSGGTLGHNGWAAIEHLGEIAATKILAAYDTIEFESETVLGVRSRRVDLRHRYIYGDSDVFGTNDGPNEWGVLNCSIDYDPETDVSEFNCAGVKLLLGALGEMFPHPEVNQTLMSVARLGSLMFVTIPGEPAYSVIKYLREQVASRRTDADPIEVMAVGYSQDHLLYFTHPDDWRVGGYEGEFSLWGPWGGRYVIDRQMELVDDLLQGFAGPAFYEESPNLLAPIPAYESRAIEISDNANTVLQDVTGPAMRLETVRFGFGGGDASMDTPKVHLEAETATDTWTAVLGPNGRDAEPYGNRRPEMVTHYRPNPAASKEVLERREHRWLVDWQVPVSFPAGRYRFVAQGFSFDGTAEVPYEVRSAAFAVIAAAADHVTAVLDGESALIQWEQVQPARVDEADFPWPERGFRLNDVGRRPTERARVTVPIKVVASDGTSSIDIPATFDPAKDGYPISLSGSGLNIATLSLTVELEADVVAAPVAVGMGQD
ncbi:MAG: hypothetical protein ACI9MR_001609 [Myxococcota bacterium]|jgi:hypothetical protein